MLDNVFDPVKALKNMMLALKPGGRVIHVEMATYHNFPYLVFSPGWFLDYYAVNKFKRCQVYVAQHDTAKELVFGPWVMWGCMPLADISLSAPTIQGSQAALVVIAERDQQSTIDINPVQGHYRRTIDQDQINAGLAQFAMSSLPFFIAENQEASGAGSIQEIALWTWVYCGRFGKG